MRRFFHIFLILSLLISTAGYAITKHFCGEVLAHVSLGQDTHSCCDTNETPSDSEMSSDCECENETDHLVVDDDYQPGHQQVKLTPAIQATLIGFFKFLACAPLLEEHENKLHLTLKSPPFTDPDIHISVQSFLL